MLPKKNRLNLRFHRNRLDEQGQVRHSPYFIIISADSSSSCFAILISRKLLRKAVARNRLKRQISELIRINLQDLPTKDFLIIPKKKILEDKSWQKNLIDMLRSTP